MTDVLQGATFGSDMAQIYFLSYNLYLLKVHKTNFRKAKGQRGRALASKNTEKEEIVSGGQIMPER